MDRLGAFRAMQAAAKYRWGSDDLRGKRVAIQGCGNVGHNLAKELHAAGARLIVSDVDPKRCKRAVEEFDAAAGDTGWNLRRQTPMYSLRARWAESSTIETIPQLKAEIVCGAANNQLLEDQEMATRLRSSRNSLRADYVVNAGGVLSGGADLFGWESKRCGPKCSRSMTRCFRFLRSRRSERIPTYKAADRLAERRLARRNRSIAGRVEEITRRWRFIDGSGAGRVYDQHRQDDASTLVSFTVFWTLLIGRPEISRDDPALD